MAGGGVNSGEHATAERVLVRGSSVDGRRARGRTGEGAQKGILIRDAESPENAHKLDAVVLDMTGTTTRGQPALTDVGPIGDHDADELLRLVA